MAIGSETSENKKDLDWDRHFLRFHVQDGQANWGFVKGRTEDHDWLTAAFKERQKGFAGEGIPPWFLHMG